MSTKNQLSNLIKKLILNDSTRIRALRAVAQLELKDGWIAAGFVRNLVWDYLHNTSTPLNDIDVIFYCLEDATLKRENQLLGRLRAAEPTFPWSIKNQVRMHLRNGDKPYHSCLHAMSHWPEKQTAIATRLDLHSGIESIHCFSLDELFSFKITHNPKREKATFDQRVTTKRWQKIWPRLSLN